MQANYIRQYTIQTLHITTEPDFPLIPIIVTHDLFTWSIQYDAFRESILIVI
jgi:hypothetical protein